MGEGICFTVDPVWPWSSAPPLKVLVGWVQLVENPVDAAVFLPQLLPDLEKVSKDVSDPECRSVCERARATLERIGGSGLAKKEAEKADLSQVKGSLASILSSNSSKVDQAVVAYVSTLAVHLIDAKQFNKDDWVAVCSFYPVQGIFFGGAVCCVGNEIHPVVASSLLRSWFCVQPSM